jgi:dihydroxy-acid dehydratase
LARGEISAGDVVVMPGMGPKGGPGTVFAASFVAALNGAGVAADVAVVTDGELSGLNRGLTIGQVMPEAAAGGPLALVRNGDRITIDLGARLVDLDVAPHELAARRATWRAPEHNEQGWLGQYVQLVQPLRQGAVLRSHNGSAPQAKPVHPGELTDV